MPSSSNHFSLNSSSFIPILSQRKGLKASRYGFNGKMKDNEVEGEGDVYDYGARMYDARLGRFMSVDPLIHKFPELSTYQYASNRPIQGIDYDGEEFHSSTLVSPALLRLARTVVATADKINTVIANSVKFQFGETTFKIGLGGGLALSTGKGTATDAIGTTFFSYKIVEALVPKEHTNDADSKFVGGVEASASLNWSIDINSTTFEQAINQAPPTTFSGAALGKFSVTMGNGVAGIGVGLGVGGSVSSLASVITESVSLSKQDIKNLDKFKANNNLTTNVVGHQIILNKNAKTNITTYTFGLVTDGGKIIDTGIKLGKVGKEERYQSDSYKKQAETKK